MNVLAQERRNEQALVELSDRTLVPDTMRWTIGRPLPEPEECRGRLFEIVTKHLAKLVTLEAHLRRTIERTRAGRRGGQGRAPLPGEAGPLDPLLLRAYA